MKTEIANPIYDVVFKYLMSDSKIAKLLISKIIEEEIVSLDFLAQERIAEINSKYEEDDDDKHDDNTKQEKKEKFLTIYRLDFCAKVKTKEGKLKNVLIEIQKAKLPSDIIRFRQYLGKHYASKENYYYEGKKQKPLPIITIYFLGYNLKEYKCPLIKISKNIEDLAAKKEITKKIEFVEGLTHNTFIVQIPSLKQKHRIEAEDLLRIFDQKKVGRSLHVLEVDEKDYPPKYRLVIRRLRQAIANQKIRDTMELEDEVLEDLRNFERELAEKDEKLAKKDEKIAEKDKKLAEKEDKLAQKNKELAENKRVLAQKDKLIQELLKKNN